MHTDEARVRGLDMLCEEPFRLFFPLGILLSALGVSHWILHVLGYTSAYPGPYHGLVQMQGFETAFATGFLMTAYPRFIESAGTHPWELLLALGLCIGGVVAVAFDAWHPAQVLFLALTLHLWIYALRRLPTRGDNPPPVFVFLAFGLASATVGGFLIAHPQPRFPGLGEALVFEGMLLGFVLAAGSHLAPRLLYQDRREAPTTGPEARRQALIYGLVALALYTTFPVGAALSAPLGYSLRGGITLAYLIWALRLYRLPATSTLHALLLWLAFWCIPIGFIACALVPTHGSALRHITYTGGYGLMTFVIATRVVVAHCGFEYLWDRTTPQIGVALAAVTLGAVLRVLSTVTGGLYWTAIAVAAGLWLGGSLWWAVVFVPKQTPRHVADDD